MDTYVELVVVGGLEVAGGRELADDLDGLVELDFRHGCKDDFLQEKMEMEVEVEGAGPSALPSLKETTPPPPGRLIVSCPHPGLWIFGHHFIREEISTRTGVTEKGEEGASTRKRRTQETQSDVLPPPMAFAPSVAKTLAASARKI